MATLINGNGNAAVYAAQDADWFASLTNGTTARMNVGDAFSHSIEDANTIALENGVIVTKEGRRIQLDAGSVDEFTIPTGEQDVTNYYIIGYHLYTDGSSNQLCETFVQQMESSSATIVENTFRGGATEVYVSVKRVTQESLTITAVEDLLGIYNGASDSNIATVEAGTTATQAYVADDYVVVGGQLYIVTSAIAIGDTFTVGTNITATTVGTELSELNSRLTVLENGVGYETLFDSGDIQIGYGTKYYSNVKPSDVADYSEVVCLAFQGTADATSETSAVVTATYYPKNLAIAVLPTQYITSNLDVSGSTIYRVAIAFASDISNNYIFARLDSINRNERYLNRFVILGRK